MSSLTSNGAGIYDAGQPYQFLQDVLNDPAASTWLKDALRAALRRDPVDAANDSAFLAELLNTRAQAAALETINFNPSLVVQTVGSRDIPEQTS